MKHLAPLFTLALACACSEATPDSAAGGASAGNAGHGGSAGRASDSGSSGAVAQGESGAAGADTGASPESAIKPHVVVAVPALDTTDVYPAPLWNGNGEEVILAVSFSEAMAPHSDFSLVAVDHQRPAAGTWSADARRLAVVAKPGFTFPQPLADGTKYALDLSALVSETGAPLEPDWGLRAGRLVFSTGGRDALLNHSCGHTFFGPFASVGAVQAADASAPDIGTTHTQYAVTLLEGEGGYGGWVRAKFEAAGQYRLYFDGETAVSLSDGAVANPQAVELAVTPLACPGISHEITLSPVLGSELFLHLEVVETSVRRVIVELVPDDEAAQP